MKKILIIYPHWPPSNLAGVHRPRLLANFLHEFGWHPVVLTVKPKYYEEPPDKDMLRLVSEKVEVHSVEAFCISKRLRVIGDIGIRGFFQMWKGAERIIKEQKVDFIFIPIPSNYTALLGRLLYEKFKIPYGIDYIDPWFEALNKGQQKVFSKRGLTKMAAGILEPISVKKASLISGVSTSYYDFVLNHFLRGKKVKHVGMPYGFDPNDHKVRIDNISYPWEGISIKPLIYAGAFLPKSHLFIDSLFKSIHNLIKKGQWDKDVHLFFLGTGFYQGKSILEYASEYGIEKYIHEDRKRSPFLHIINFLSASYGVMVIGSTEKHYTASKTFQAMLSEKPVFAVFHGESSAVQIMRETDADAYVVKYNEEIQIEEFRERIEETFLNFIRQDKVWEPKLNNLDKFSSRNSAKMLAEKLDEIVG